MIMVSFTTIFICALWTLHYSFIPRVSIQCSLEYFYFSFYCFMIRNEIILGEQGNWNCWRQAGRAWGMSHKGSNESQIPQKSFENCHQCCQGHQKESKGSKEKFERQRKSCLDEGDNIISLLKSYKNTLHSNAFRSFQMSWRVRRISRASLSGSTPSNFSEEKSPKTISTMITELWGSLR